MGKSAINPAVVGKHSTDIAALKNDLGIVEDGDTATHTIAQGQYVIWQGALYTADAAIASGTTLAASGGNKNLTAVANGGLNLLNDKIGEWEDIVFTGTYSGTLIGKYNTKTKIAIIGYNSESSNTGATVTMNVTALIRLYGFMRYGGYLRTTTNSTTLTIENSNAYAVGEVIFPVA